jgi:dTDP-4-dehydrorhamnose 3,5-epimerase-like enzyme
VKRWQQIAPIRVGGDRGSLWVLERESGLPFIPKRVFWISGVPSGETRGFHAHRTGEQILFCLSGQIRAKFYDGEMSEDLMLDAHGQGVWMRNLVWGEQTFVSSDAILLVIASNDFDEEDYIREKQEFEKLRQ